MTKSPKSKATVAVEKARLEAKLDGASKDWTTARRALANAQVAVTKAEAAFDKASNALQRFHNPELFDLS